MLKCGENVVLGAAGCFEVNRVIIRSEDRRLGWRRRKKRRRRSVKTTPRPLLLFCLYFSFVRRQKLRLKEERLVKRVPRASQVRAGSFPS